MVLFILFLFTLLMSPVPSPVPAEKIVKESIRSQGKERIYYLFVPDKISPATSVPLIVLLHGSGRNGLSLVEKWNELAKKEGIIIVGPDSLTSQGWKIPDDGPDFIHELVEALKAKYPITLAACTYSATQQGPDKLYTSRCLSQSISPRQLFMLER